MTLDGLGGRPTKGHLVVQHDVVADFSCLTNNNTAAVVNEEPPADGCTRVDLNAGQRPHRLRQQTRGGFPTGLVPQTVNPPMRPNGVQARVAQRSDNIVRRRGVTAAGIVEVFAHSRPHVRLRQTDRGGRAECRAAGQQRTFEESAHQCMYSWNSGVDR